MHPSLYSAVELESFAVITLVSTASTLKKAPSWHEVSFPAKICCCQATTSHASIL